MRHRTLIVEDEPDVAPAQVDHLYFVTVTGIATPSIDARIVALIPDAWLEDEPGFADKAGYGLCGAPTAVSDTTKAAIHPARMSLRSSNSSSASIRREPVAPTGLGSGSCSRAAAGSIRG